MRVVVLGEGRSERSGRTRGAPHSPVPIRAQGAGEILVSRLLEQRGHGSTIIEPAGLPAKGAATAGGRASEKEVIQRGSDLEIVVNVSLMNRLRPELSAQFVVILTDVDAPENEKVARAVEYVNNHTPKAAGRVLHLVAKPEFEALLGGDKEAVEAALSIDQCRFDAKEEMTKGQFQEACRTAGLSKTPTPGEYVPIAKCLNLVRGAILAWSEPLLQALAQEKK